MRAASAVAHDSLDLEKLVQPECAPFAAKAGLLVAAERRGGVEPLPVEVDVPGPDATRHRARVLQIARRHVARQSVWRVVRDADCFFFVGVGQYAEHRTEDLFARDG